MNAGEEYDRYCDNVSYPDVSLVHQNGRGEHSSSELHWMPRLWAGLLRLARVAWPDRLSADFRSGRTAAQGTGKPPSANFWQTALPSFRTLGELMLVQLHYQATTNSQRIQTGAYECLDRVTWGADNSFTRNIEGGVKQHWQTGLAFERI